MVALKVVEEAARKAVAAAKEAPRVAAEAARAAAALKAAQKEFDRAAAAEEVAN